MPRNSQLHNYAAAYKLIKSLKDLVAQYRALHSYPESSEHFLEFVENAAAKSLLKLEEKLEGYNREFRRRESSLLFPLSVMHGWELLHAFIKPVADANTLSIPYPLSHFISKHICSLKAVGEAQIVVEIVSELGYLQHPHTKMRNAIRQLPGVISKDVKFGFIAMPCSQSKNLFLNCLLYHEAGHFIAEEAGIFPLSKSNDQDLERKLTNKNRKLQPHIQWASETIQKWMEELFADLVAVRLIGPAYTLAYFELLRLVYNVPARQEVRSFSSDHPADALRLREQLKVLELDCWEYPHALSLWPSLEKLANSPEHSYVVFPDEGSEGMGELYKILIAVMCQKGILKELHHLANKFTKDRENPSSLFSEAKTIIRTCLEHAVVPSRAGRGGQMPHPIAIINGTFQFWLEGMGELYKRIPKFYKNRLKAEYHALLSQRVELWAIKAIEDWLTRN